MGFGILLIGYMISFSLNPGITDFIAYTIIFYAMLKLGDYNIFFRVAKLLSFAVAVFGMAGLMLTAGQFIGFVDASNTYIDLYDHASETLKIIFHIPLLLGISRISRETDLPKYSATAIWCIILDILYAVVYVLCFVEPGLLRYRMVMRGVTMIIVAILVFNCFRMICKEGDENTPWYTVRLPKGKEKADKKSKKTENENQD